MNEFRIRESGQVVTEPEFRAMHIQMFPQVIDVATLDEYGADPVLAAPQPAITTEQTASRDGVVLDGLGNWVHAWLVNDLSAEVIAANLASAIQAQNDAVQAEIAALELGSLLNRGSREMQIWQLEDEARKYSETYGISIELVLSGNIYYPQVKALDAAAKALRDQLS